MLGRLAFLSAMIIGLYFQGPISQATVGSGLRIQLSPGLRKDLRIGSACKRISRNAGPSGSVIGQPHAVSDLYEFLNGRWRVSREIQDKRAATVVHFKGIAEFNDQFEFPAGALAELAYIERGELEIAGRVIFAERKYRYRFLAGCSGEAEVLFDDGPSEGQFFHTLQLREGICSASHLCVEDMYTGEFRSTSPLSWEVIWHVCGPEKQQVLHSIYQRESDGDDGQAGHGRGMVMRDPTEIAVVKCAFLKEILVAPDSVRGMQS